MKIEFNNLAGFEPTDDIESTVCSVLEDIQLGLVKEGVISKKLEYEISVALVDRDEIKKLNFEYRKNDESTDVLSFGYERSDEDIQGELILCPEIIWENAIEDGIDPMEELLKNLIHGILHVSGYEHGDEMFGIQDLVLSSLLPVYGNSMK